MLAALLTLVVPHLPTAAADWPVPDWGSTPPADTGLDPTRVAAAVGAAFTEPASGRGRGTHAFLVVRQGRIVAERYAPGIGPATPLLGWSATKTVMAVLAGVLVRDGLLALDAPADVPSWQRRGDPRRAITLDQVLRMSTGLAFDETYDLRGLFRVGTLRMLYGEGRHDMAAYAADRPLAHAPGSVFAYSSGTSNLLAGLVRRALGGTAADYHAFPRRALFEPLGMRSAIVETDGVGTFVGSSYMHATARDWARLGLLLLRDGVWAGRRLLPPGWVAYMRAPAPASRDRVYGAHVWLLDGIATRDRHPALGRGMPRDAFYAAGRGGQYVAVVPSLDLVLVRLGRLAPGAPPFDLADSLADLAAAARRNN
jgi:CubicO group peptidase (beta-lactamase class C family)